MTNTFKKLAIAALMGTVSAPVFAAAHMSPSMTCAEYKALSTEDQMTVATLAIAEVDDGANGTSMESEATATTTSTDVPAAEATDGVAEETSLSDGEPKAVEATGGDTVASNSTAVPMDEAALEQFMLVCDRNLDATVGEAAAGLEGTR